MRNIIIKLLVMSFLIVLSLSCGDKKGSDNNSGSISFLPKAIENAGVTMSSEAKTYVGETLYEYINGGAEVYHQYGFEEVSTAYYQKDETEFILDVYQFGSVEGSYGLYSSTKFEDDEILAYGVEGYYSGNRLDFVKDKYLIRITGYDETSRDIIEKIAQFMSGHIPGSADFPKAFSQFADGGQLSNKKIYSEAYLGIKELTDFYTIDYLIGSDTVTLFLSDDEGGGKFMKWSQKLDEINTVKNKTGDIAFDDNHGFSFEHSYYGTVIAGLKNGKLIGIINYSDVHKKTLTAWLDKLPE